MGRRKPTGTTPHAYRVRPPSCGRPTGAYRWHRLPGCGICVGPTEMQRTGGLRLGVAQPAVTGLLQPDQLAAGRMSPRRRASGTPCSKTARPAQSKLRSVCLPADSQLHRRRCQAPSSNNKIRDGSSDISTFAAPVAVPRTSPHHHAKDHGVPEVGRLSAVERSGCYCSQAPSRNACSLSPCRSRELCRASPDRSCGRSWVRRAT